MVDTRRPRSPRPPVRLRPAPPLDPPCTDEDPAWGHAGQLALDLLDHRRQDLGRPADRPADRSPGWPRWSASGAPRTVLGEGGTPRNAAVSGDGVGWPPAAGPPRSALATATPEAARAAHRFVRTFLEIVNGFRPPGQLRPLCLPEAAAQVSAELTRASRRVTPVRRRSARPALLLRRLRVCEPRAGAVEATAVFAGADGTSWAVALRLEHRRGNWLCLVLDVL
ncbi:Rv3235 family protein [Micromonospora sp. WMMC241]|uniref:Rv3235 family protein n=1 Tax=Micromonospora sp. WMMC241 TaxID=3015159 RepID=UPI0022B64A18|nr:Rv3235 family protein [Micromonospora sp. WMMC241]MCZ7439615.1 Rv3235 family protein [Micromonospora sp. WMMC241]